MNIFWNYQIQTTVACQGKSSDDHFIIPIIFIGIQIETHDFVRTVSNVWQTSHRAVKLTVSCSISTRKDPWVIRREEKLEFPEGNYSRRR